MRLPLLKLAKTQIKSNLSLNCVQGDATIELGPEIAGPTKVTNHWDIR